MLRLVTDDPSEDDPPARRPWFGGPSVHTLRISLVEVEPTVWRRFSVDSEIKLPRVNRLLEAVMGWEGYHLHQFEVADLRIGEPDEDLDEVINEKSIKLRQLLPREASTVRWAYDFGDNWQHDIIVEAIDHPSPEIRYPLCLDGAGACPPEDCGGVGGYERMLEALNDPKDEEHDDFTRWAPPGFDPKAFDPDDVTRRLRRVR